METDERMVVNRIRIDNEWGRTTFLLKFQIAFDNLSRVIINFKLTDWFLYDNGLRHERVKYL